MSEEPRRFVGVQIGPAPFVDEGVDTVLDTLQNRVGVNVLMLGTVSWLGLKSGRSISHEVDGWPDHGIAEPLDVQGGSYLHPRPELYRTTFLSDFRAPDDGMRGKDIIEIENISHASALKLGAGDDDVMVTDTGVLLEVDGAGGGFDTLTIDRSKQRAAINGS